MSITPIRPAPPARTTRKPHPLIEAGRSGSRLAVLKASLEFALLTLANPDCADYVKSNLLGKVQALSKEIEDIEKAAAEEAESGHDDGGERDYAPWDPAAI